MNFDHFSTDDLADRCAQEASKKQGVGRDDNWCFQLLCRAFGLEDQHALNHVYKVYHNIWSQRWVRDASLFDSQSMTMDDFKIMAFHKVYDHFKGDNLSGFKSLTPLLSYFHTTLIHIIGQYIRSSKSKRRPTIYISTDDDDNLIENIAAPDDPSAETEKKLLWEAVEKHLADLFPNKNDRLLLDYWLKQHLSYAQIVAARPDIWPDVDKVRVDLQRIRRRMGNDPGLNDLLSGLL